MSCLNIRLIHPAHAAVRATPLPVTFSAPAVLDVSFGLGYQGKWWSFGWSLMKQKRRGTVRNHRQVFEYYLVMVYLRCVPLCSCQKLHDKHLLGEATWE